MKKRRTRYLMRDCRTGRTRTVEHASGVYEVGRKYRLKSKLDGSWYEEECMEIKAPVAGFNSIPAPGLYPMWSDAMGLNPDQIPEAMEADRAMGFHNIEYHPDTGAIRFPDKATRKRYCEAQGVHDLNGGYGDPQKR